MGKIQLNIDHWDTNKRISAYSTASVILHKIQKKATVHDLNNNRTDDWKICTLLLTT